MKSGKRAPSALTKSSSKRVRTSALVGEAANLLSAALDNDQLDAVSDAISDELVAEKRLAPTDWSENMSNDYNYNEGTLETFLRLVRGRLEHGTQSLDLPLSEIPGIATTNWQKTVDDLRTDVDRAVS